MRKKDEKFSYQYLTAVAKEIVDVFPNSVICSYYENEAEEIVKDIISIIRDRILNRGDY